MKVLIVDDSKAMQKILAKALESLGYQHEDFIFADDGNEGAEIIPFEEPDLVFTDMHMPNATGLDMIKNLRAKGNQTKVILVSIDDDNTLEEQVLQAGGNAFLKKPFTAPQLYEVVDKILAGEAEKVEAKESERHWTLPEADFMARLCSGLAQSPVQIKAVSYSDLDYQHSPFCGATLMDDMKHIALTLFMDLSAANLLAAVMGHQALEKTLSQVSMSIVDEDVKQSMRRFAVFFSSYCQPQKDSQPLIFHGEQYAEDPSTILKTNMDKIADKVIVWQLEYAGLKGRLMLAKSGNFG